MSGGWGGGGRSEAPCPDCLVGPLALNHSSITSDARGAPAAAGRFVFAIVLGAGVEEVKARLAAVRSGEAGLRLRHHVLVLNWWGSGG